MTEPAGGYVQCMLEPGGWPQVDEKIYYQRANQFVESLRQVTAVLETSQQQRRRVFDGGAWSGASAEAADACLGTNIDQLTTLQNDLVTVITWHNHVAGLIAQAKSHIGDNVQGSQQEITALENTPGLTADARNTAIGTLVDASHATNVSIVNAAAEQIRASKAWNPPQNALQPLLDQITPPQYGQHPLPEDWDSAPTEAGVVSGGGLAPSPPGATSPFVIPKSTSRIPSTSGETLTPGDFPAGAMAPAATAIGPPPTGTPTRQPNPKLVTPQSATAPTAEPLHQPASWDSSPPIAPTAAAGPLPQPLPPIGSGGAGAGSGAAARAAAGSKPLGTPPDARAATPAAQSARAARPGRREPTDPTPQIDAAAASVIPVSTSRAQRDAIAAGFANGGGPRSRREDPLRQARRISAALNAPDINGEDNVEFFWITAVTTDGDIVVANSYGLAYVPDEVHLPMEVQMATADQRISASERASWATYPVLALQGWAAHHSTKLRAVIATKEQLANIDPGAAKIVLEHDDVPESGKMTGRSRLEVVDPQAASRLAKTGDLSLIDRLPPASVDTSAPEDRRLLLWLPLMMTMVSDVAGRETAHLQAFHAYAAHAEEIALYQARTTPEPELQRTAVADWLYWQHLTRLHHEALAGAS